jgi:cell wall-associated NlpC family hydrolase
MPLNRKATMKEVEKSWFTPCSDNLLVAYKTNELTGKGGSVQVNQEFQRLKHAGKLPGDGWKAVIIPDVDSSGKPIRGLYGNERGCFVREDASGTEIPLPGEKPPGLRGKFLIVPFYKCGGQIVKESATADGLVDCAHFVSSCLTVGGVKIHDSGVPGLVKKLQKRTDTRTLGHKVTQKQGTRILDTGAMKPGDVIAYFHEGGYQHSAIYTGRDRSYKHRIACHTIARFNQYFWDDIWSITTEPSWLFTLIHFDDVVMSATGAPRRCEVKSGSATEVYYFYSNGVVKRAQGNRTSHHVVGASPRDQGYWFEESIDSCVIWPHTGEVVTIPVRVDLFSDLALAASMPIDLTIKIDNHPATMTPY